MSKVVRLNDHRRAAREGRPGGGTPFAVQASRGVVALVLPPAGADGGHWLSPGQAHELAIALLNASRDASGARRG